MAIDATACPPAPAVAVARTGAANLASVAAGLLRAGADPFITDDPDSIAGAGIAMLPGVGAFGPAMERLERSGMAAAFRDRFRNGRPTMGICLGMQLFFEGSDEAPGIGGLALVPGIVRKFAGGLPLPQLGWNRVVTLGTGNGLTGKLSHDAMRDSGSAPREDATATGDPRGIVLPGWAYFANSYRVSEVPEGFRAAFSTYGERFLASVERTPAGSAAASAPHGGFSPTRRDHAAGRPALLLCQFHPELSGRWGLSLLRRWLGTDRDSREAEE